MTTTPPTERRIPADEVRATDEAALAVTYRVRRVSLLDSAVLGSVFSVLPYLVLVVVSLLGRSRFLEASIQGAIAAVLLGSVGGVIVAWVFNLYGRFGGLHVTLHREPPASAPAPMLPGSAETDLLRPSAGSDETKVCPSCGHSVRADRSFCMNCDHHF